MPVHSADMLPTTERRGLDKAARGKGDLMEDVWGAIPKYLPSPLTYQTIVAAVDQYIKMEGVSRSALSTMISDFVEGEAKPYDLKRKARLGENDLRRYLDALQKNKPARGDIPEAIWLWLHIKAPTIVAEEKSKLEKIRDHGFQFSETIHTFLLPGEPFSHQTVAEFSGDYLFYRPHFMDPEQVMVAHLRCGAPEPGKFTLRMVYPRTPPYGPKDTIEGHLIPYRNNVLFQGRFLNLLGPFIFILRDIVMDSQSRHVGKAEGVALAGIQGDPPSAYPVLIKRHDGPLELGVFPQDHFKNDAQLLRVMKRGVVAWM